MSAPPDLDTAPERALAGSAGKTQRSDMYRRFGLTLMVNHTCNLRCTYCYTGDKFHSSMPRDTGRAAVDRAFRSLAPGGRLDLGFFGGEPLIEAKRILDWMTYARTRARESGKNVRFDITTNGTIANREAWQAMSSDDLNLAVSFDGDPRIHDRHRRDKHGRGSSIRVTDTLRKLIRAKKRVCVVVVRPDNLDDLPNGLSHLYYLGIQQVELSLDLWATWTAEDGLRLQTFIERAARLWQRLLPDFHINWIEAKLAELAGLPASEENTCCGFGGGAERALVSL